MCIRGVEDGRLGRCPHVYKRDRGWEDKEGEVTCISGVGYGRVRTVNGCV